MIRATLHADRWSGPPLAKKFGAMNAGILPLERYKRDLAKAAALQPDSLRIDLSVGKKVGWKRQMVGGTANALVYDWDELDWLTDALAAQGVRPYYAFCYMPRPLQQNGNWRSPPSDSAAWQEANRAFAEHCRGRNAVLEVYNEPDFREFFVGTREEYLALYAAGARGMRDGDPEASVGGPALAFSLDWIDPFLDHVRDHRLPLDFFSFHTIGVPLQDPPTRQVALERLRAVRSALAARPGFEATEIHLNEYHPYKNTAEGLERPTDSPALGVEMLEDFIAFLEEGDLTLVHWAQLMDSGFGGETFGLLDEAGRARPAFYVLAAYNDLPVRRLGIDVQAPLGGIAGGDPARGGVLLWNRSDAPQKIALDGLPNRCQAFRIGHDAPLLPLATPPGLPANEEMAGEAWTTTLGPSEVVYLRWGVDPIPLSASVVRTHRLGRAGHAVFDRRTTAAHTEGTVGGATLDGLPQRSRLRVEAEPGPLSLRVDYAVGEGFARSLLLRDGGDPPTTPWGTGRRPSEIVERSLRGESVLDLAAHAPEGWRGQAILSFWSAGRAIFTLVDAR